MNYIHQYLDIVEEVSPVLVAGKRRDAWSIDAARSEDNSENSAV